MAYPSFQPGFRLIDGTDLVNLAAAVGTNAATTATNTANIATNAANTATNTANIVTNTAGIAANTASLAKLNTAVAGLTALAGGGQAGATPLTAYINEVAVCATNADSVLLPVPLVGQTVVVINDGAATLAVFPSGAGKIVLHAGATQQNSAVQLTTETATYYCFAAGVWKQMLTA